MELQENSNVIINENFRGSIDVFFDHAHPDVAKIKLQTENGNVKNAKDVSPPRTTYLETLMHLFKGNVGPGKF